jgi:hypothetical protein
MGARDSGSAISILLGIDLITDKHEYMLPSGF